MQAWQQNALDLLDGLTTIPDFSMAQLTTFKIGGPIDLLVEVKDLDELQRTLQFCATASQPWIVVGFGSNLLVRDKGIRGVGIKLGGIFKDWEISGETSVVSGAAVALADLAKGTAAQGLSGLEFACGIPGTVGGAVYMNAGAYEGDMSKVVTSVEAFRLGDGCRRFESTELEFNYRFSVFQRQSWVITRASFQLEPAAIADTTAKVTTLTCSRESKQPLEMPSAGSVFRRPPGYFVGPLIEQAGLKGYKIGGAQVSPKHAGFIVNSGGATAGDVLQLIAHIQQVIRNREGVELIPEITVIGEE